MIDWPVGRRDGGAPAARRWGEIMAVVSIVAALTVLSWWYLVALADAMDAMADGRDAALMFLMPMGPWGAWQLILCFGMWVVMMVAMMAPTAVPMLLAFHAMVRQRLDATTAMVRVGAFLLGYVVSWAGFSAAAAACQWALHESATVTDGMVSASRSFDAALLLLAGAWQFVPAKAICLSKCRTPFGFLMTEWREGPGGALLMGLRHGGFCIGCCWALMALLFVAGVMNLGWIALLSSLVLVEKFLPGGLAIARVAGVASCAAGTWLILAA